MIFDVVLISAVQQSDSVIRVCVCIRIYIYTHALFLKIFFSIMVYHGTLNIILVLHGRTLLLSFPCVGACISYTLLKLSGLKTSWSSYCSLDWLSLCWFPSTYMFKVHHVLPWSNFFSRFMYTEWKSVFFFFWRLT